MNCLVYRQESSIRGRVVGAVIFLLGIGAIVNGSGSILGFNDSRELSFVSISIQMLIGGLLIAIGIRGSLETATISFDKIHSSVSFVRRVVLQLPAVTADLTNFDSVVVRPTIWGGGVHWYCVYLTGADQQAEFGLFAEPDQNTAKQKANEVSKFLELQNTPENA